MAGTREAATVEEAAIEEAHAAACRAQQDTYVDPATGYLVMTEWNLRRKAACCGNACRHCPYGHARVAPATAAGRARRRLVAPALLAPRAGAAGALDALGGRDALGALGGLDAPQKGAGPDQDQERSQEVTVVFWSGGKDSLLALAAERARGGGARVCLLTTVDAAAGAVPVQAVSVRAVSFQAAALALPLCLVPRADGDDDYARAVRAALAAIAAHFGGARVRRLVFGDLFLADIRAWRVAAFEPDFECVFPLFGRPYAELLPRLWDLVDRFDLRVYFSVSYSQELSDWLRARNKSKNMVSHSESDIGKMRILYSRDLVEDPTFPVNVDKMGERGEFHTRVEFLDMWDCETDQEW